jgi:hypothetical protein
MLLVFVVQVSSRGAAGKSKMRLGPSTWRGKYLGAHKHGKELHDYYWDRKDKLIRFFYPFHNETTCAAQSQSEPHPCFHRKKRCAWVLIFTGFTLFSAVVFSLGIFVIK